MQTPSSTIASWHTGCYYYPVPIHLVSHLPIKITHKSIPQNLHCSKNSSISILTTPNCTNDHENKRKQYPDKENRKLYQDFYSSIEIPEHRLVNSEEEAVSEVDTALDISTKMWWTDLKGALGQRINLEGITASVGILSRDKHLVMPHVYVPDIRYIDWVELKNRGFKGVVFDKDNTITVPYSLSLWPRIGSSVERCKSSFGNNIAVYSNSAGLNEYDPDGTEAKALEDAIGIKVIRHRLKKPAGTAEEIERHFDCESSKLIMVGDRPFTDIVFGNRNGFFTILTEPLSVAEEPLIVRQVRMIEVAIVKQWTKKGFKPNTHNLLPDSVNCVKDEPQA